jgi:hypothetical protein
MIALQIRLFAPPLVKIAPPLFKIAPQIRLFAPPCRKVFEIP